MSSPRRLCLAVLAAALLLRLIFAFTLPMSGDEAYYYLWGVYPSYGGYDHPGMVGWVMAPLVKLGNAPWLIRLPAVLLLAAMTWLTWRLARPAGEDRAWLAATAVTLVPVDLLNILTTTDTPLVFFCLASLAAYQRAVIGVRRGAASTNGWYWLAGTLLGAALFSKYFAGLLAIAYLVYALTARRGERVWPGLIVVALTSLPWFLLNMYWNYENCWLNILFNFYTRHDNVVWSPRDMTVYVLIVLYCTSPLLLWQLVRCRAPRDVVGREGGQETRGVSAGDPAYRLVLCAFVVPIAIFGLLSTVKSIGLHWVFAYTPLAFVLAAWRLDAQAWRRNLTYLGALGVLHVVAVVTIMLLPLETWHRSRLYDGIVMTVEPDAVLRELAPYAGEFAFATDGYSNSVTLSYARRRLEHPGPQPVASTDTVSSGDFLVFGPGSAHGRQQDRYDDFTVFARGDRHNILIFRKTPPPHDEYDPYFATVDYRSFELRGVTYYLILGRGFRYETYRDRVLRAIREKFYAVPSWLPEGQCFFCERYFGSRECRG